MLNLLLRQHININVNRDWDEQRYAFYLRSTCPPVIKVSVLSSGVADPVPFLPDPVLEKSDPDPSDPKLPELLQPRRQACMENHRPVPRVEYKMRYIEYAWLGW